MPSSTSQGRPHRPLSIAIVDDDQATLEAMGLLAYSLGWYSRIFRSPTEFLLSQPGDDYDCLILDLHMPRMNGAELLDELHRRRIYIPAIIVTSNCEDPLTELARMRGARAVLNKPFRDEELLEEVERAIR